MFSLEIIFDDKTQNFLLYVNGKPSKTFANWEEVIGFWRSLIKLIPDLPLEPEVTPLSRYGL